MTIIRVLRDFHPPRRSRVTENTLCDPSSLFCTSAVNPQVRLVVYDLLGREVAILGSERNSPGSYEVKIDAAGLASGVYLYRLTAGSLVQTRKMVVIK